MNKILGRAERERARLRWCGRWAPLIATLLLSALTAPAAHAQRVVVAGPAQEPSEAELAQAIALFEAGLAHAENARWADALSEFEEAYELSGHPPVLFNYATTLMSVGRYLDARDAFDQLMRDHVVEGELRATVEGMRQEAAERVGTLRVEALPEAAPELVLRLDGLAIPDLGLRPLPLETDGGRHSFQVELPGYETFLWEGRVLSGQTQTIQVSLVELPQKSNALAAVLWTTLAVALAVGLAVGGYFLFRDLPPEPQGDYQVTLL